MANSLLDFVMSLVRDPDAAARYAADPAQALADAHLTDVTTADVANLIPVVSESLSMAAPTHSLDALDFEPVSNVWTSGAATAAFDAFDDQLPTPVIVDTQADTPVVVDDVDPGFEVLTSADMVDPVVSPQIADPDIDDLGATGTALVEDWAQPLDTADTGDHVPGFDLFD
ncbi:Rv0340 family IniB-related protein [Mycobacterium sp. pW049]|uniref:Rv0340 family IniB-related protein n=1 Tax=[Mycobacterium] bulgaricum TaxID=3238985 RepID=UPI00351BCA48